jgi:DNA replication protein DnaC
MEGTMQSVARILTANPAGLHLEEQAAEIPYIGRGNESENECPHCRGSGWRWIHLPGSAGMKQFECVAERARARKLALIPERFRDSSFQSFKPCDPKQQRALSLMQKDPGGSWYLSGAYGNGKTHLL